MTAALCKRKGAFEQLVGGILHRKQLWFHGALNREECEQRMRNYGVKDGLFLIRERTQVSYQPNYSIFPPIFLVSMTLYLPVALNIGSYSFLYELIIYDNYLLFVIKMLVVLVKLEWW